MAKILGAPRLVPDLAPTTTAPREDSLGVAGSFPVVPGESWDVATIRRIPLMAGGTPPLLGAAPGQLYAAEQYRIIRTRISQTLARPFVVAISSPGGGDGKTMTAINLAAALALSGEGLTLLVDGDLRGANVNGRLRMARSPGLADVLLGSARLEEAFVRFEQLPSLVVLPAGEEVANPTDLFGSPRWPQLTETLRQHFVQVVIDCPPVDLFADFDLIHSMSDGVVAVIRPDYTDRTLLTAALEKLQPKLVGVVLNGVEDWFLWKKSSSRYYSHYGPDGKRRGGAEAAGGQAGSK